MKFEFSSGGVVFKLVNKQPEFLIVQHSGHHRWVLPKGWIEKGEKKEETAIREVKEEAGVEAEIKDYLGDFEIFYVNPEKEKVKKKNYFYLLEYKSGEAEKDHGWEVENTLWLKPEAAIEKLDYPGEKEMVKKAAEILRGGKPKE